MGCTHTVSNSQGGDLGRLVTPARTSGFSSIQGDLVESGKGIIRVLRFLPTLPLLGRGMPPMTWL